MANGKGKGLLLIALGALFAAASGGKAKAAKKPLPPPPRPPFDIELPPVPEDMTAIDDAICSCAIDLAGYTGNVAEAMLECTAQKLFPQVPWPPIQNDHQSVFVWWDFLATQIVLFMDDPEAFCERLGPEPDGQPVDFEYGPASVEDYPYERPRIHHGGNGKHYPTPSTFYILDADNASLGLPTQLASIAKAALGSALAMAGADVELANEPGLRLQMKELIVCSPWNDAISGTTNETAAGGYLGPHGRGLTWYPRHKGNLELLSQGSAAERNVGLNGAKLGVGSRQLQLWLPAVNLEALRAPMPRVTTDGMEWSNGASTINPPPAVSSFGVISPGVEPPGGQFWGCE